MKIKKTLLKFKGLVSVYHFLLSFSGALFYFFPSRKIKVFAVTGTNGKTTTVDLMTEVFKEAGYRVAAFSSVKFEIAGEEEKNLFKMTMPGRAVLQSLLRKAVRKGCDIAIMEVTSEGIKQHRHRFIDFDAACFTNLTPEHIESHGGFENYKKEKGKLFRAVSKAHIINIDDDNAGYFLQFPAKKKILYGIKKDFQKREGSVLVKAENIKADKNSLVFSIGEDNFFLPLSGKFNVYNALAAASLALTEGVEMESIKKGLKKAKGIPGRMEEVISSPFNVIIDYAVTPETLEEVYKEIKENFSPTRLIAVFGSCGGGRDKWKRPVMGEIAAKYCEAAIITNEDPYDEDPQEIMDQIEEGFLRYMKTLPEGKKPHYWKIIDRREAVRKALEFANPGDAIIVTGKGDESWMCLADGKKIPWKEREVIKEEHDKRKV